MVGNSAKPAALALVVALSAATASRAENLERAWAIALGVNQGLQSQETQSVAAGLNVAAAKAARLPTVRSLNFNTYLSNPPSAKATIPAGTGSSASPAGSTILFPILGKNQTDLPFSFTSANVPIYTGGRIKRNIDAANYQLNAQRTEVFRTALDLKLTVAEAYISVLRGRRDLGVARSNVERLTSFATDVANRRQQGLAIRSDELAAQVSLANAQLSEIQARTTLEQAWATYNRYLDRPLEMMVELDELSNAPPTADWKELAARAVRGHSEFAALNDGEVRALTDRALQGRPELAGLTEQARALGAQAEATLGTVRPQVGFNGGYIYLGAQNWVPQGFAEATFYVDWTLSDGGASRRRAASLRQQECATLQRRADTAANIALEVRTRWLDLQQSRRRIPVARVAIAQAEENINVVLDRYKQQLSTYTEVLDAENRRVQSYTNYYNAVYDESLAMFRLRRAVGDL